MRSVSGSYEIILTELSWAFLTQFLCLKGDWEGRGRGVESGSDICHTIKCQDCCV